MLNKKKGITLIALVVTIIILLILTAVTIALLFGENGIIIKAKQGKIEGRAATLRDKISVWHAENNIKSKTGEGIKIIEAFTTELRNQGLLENDEEVNDILADRILVLATEEKDKFRVEVDFNGWKSPKIGDIVIYDPTAGITDPTNDPRLTYTSPVGSALAGANISGNGNSPQTFEVNENDTEWIVIGKENGQLKLMSKELKKNINNAGLSLQDGRGYLYAEEQLHKICSIYGYGKGADKTKVTQYKIGNPYITGEIQNKEITGSGARSITIEDLQEMSNAELTETNPNTDNPTTAVYMPSLNGVDERGQCTDANKKSNIPYTYKYTHKDNFNIKPEYSSLINEIFKGSPHYWLAFRSVYTDTSIAYFSVRFVGFSTVGAYYACYGNASSSDSAMSALGVRPVVYLESGVQLNEISAGVWKLVQ